MIYSEILSAFDSANVSALAVLLLCWLLYPLFAKLIGSSDLTSEMVKFRGQWLLQMLAREDRITDISLARGLFSSVMFFASTSIFLISGLLGVLASASYIHQLMQDSTWLVHSSVLLFETKVLVLIAIQVHSFFKFTWSMRLHSYSTLLIGAAPGPDQQDSEAARKLIEKAASLSSLASQSYFSGLRGYYFGLAALSWFISPSLLIATVILTTLILLRREHFSRALKALQLDD